MAHSNGDRQEDDMPKTAVITARMEPDVKSEAERIFQELGITTSEAIGLFFNQVRLQQGLPFEVRIPNAETRAALDDMRLRRGLKSYGSAKEMLQDLDA